MHAIVVQVSIDPGQVEQAQAALQEQVVPRASGSPGFVAGYWTRSADNTNGISMSIFDSEENANAVAQMARSMAPAGVTVNSVEVREVVASA